MFVLKGLIGSFPPLKGSRSLEIADLVRGRPWNKTGRQTYDKTCQALSDTLETKLNVSLLTPSHRSLSLSLPRSDLLIRPRGRVDGGRRPEVSFSVDSGSLRSSVIETRRAAAARRVHEAGRAGKLGDVPIRPVRLLSRVLMEHHYTSRHRAKYRGAELN